MEGMMGRTLRGHCLAAFALVAAGCSHLTGGQAAPHETALCADAGVAIFTAFPGAGQHGCALSPDGPVLTVWPEAAPAGPINPSPWYAFDIEARHDGPTTVRLDYGAHEHRYVPWVQHDGSEGWTRLPETAVEEIGGGRVAVLTLPPSRGRMRVAGQPIRAAGDVAAWSAQMAANYGAAEVSYGKSLLGEPLSALLAGPEDASQLIVLMTGQHPPEYPGARGFELAAEAMLADLPGDTRLLLLPLVNPDGVAEGHWRHTAAGLDPNRDWFDGSLPEVRSAKALIEREAAGRRIVAFLDFHSTRRTLVYTPHFETDLADMSLARALRTAMDASLDPDPEWISGHNAAQGTSKNWALSDLGVGALTIEIGDDADETQIRTVAALTAETLQQFLRR